MKCNQCGFEAPVMSTEGPEFIEAIEDPKDHSMLVCVYKCPKCGKVQ